MNTGRDSLYTDTHVYELTVGRKTQVRLPHKLPVTANVL